MRQYRVGVSGFNKIARGPTVVTRNWLMPKPNDRPVGVAGQFLRAGQNSDHWLQALLHDRRFGPLGERVAMDMGELREIIERQAQTAAHALRRYEVPFTNVGEQSRQHRPLVCTIPAYIAL